MLSKPVFIFALGSAAWLLVGCQTSSSNTSLFGSAPLPAITDARTARVQNVVQLEPGQTVTLAELDSPGVIRHIWFTARNGGQRLYKNLVLRAWWDGEDAPSIEAPLSDFVGIGWGEEHDLSTSMSELVQAGPPNHAALNLWWPMPFESCRLTLEHQGDETCDLFFWIINVEHVATMPADWGRLHAQWRRQNPVPRGGPYVVCDAHGAGRYVGTVMNYHLLEPGSWVEGGESFFIDDDALTAGAEPTLKGIGSEDYFGLSWGYRSEHELPDHGVSFGPVPESGQPNGRMTAYRWHVRDPIRFARALRVEFRCHGWDVQGRSDDYSSVAIWYQHEPHAAFPTLPAPDKRVPENLD